ncbi:MAG: hypothetical protein GXP62_06610 [Oligoflexia bacterium]|nr:hypothetical protein [Oligoflexia bacterium]
MPDPSRQIADADTKPSKKGPGCGLAIYALLLLVICAVGVLGVLLSTWNLIGSSNQVNPLELQSGSDVAARRLTPMRDAGLIGADELPLAWHDESPDMSGTVSCALTMDAVVRLDKGDARRLAYDEMGSVETLSGAGGQVVLVHPKKDATDQAATEIACRFNPHEGGNRFLRQVQVELLKREQGGG